MTIFAVRLEWLKKHLRREPSKQELVIFNAECDRLSKLTGLKF